MDLSEPLVRVCAPPIESGAVSCEIRSDNALRAAEERESIKQSPSVTAFSRLGIYCCVAT